MNTPLKINALIVEDFILSMWQLPSDLHHVITTGVANMTKDEFANIVLGLVTLYSLKIKNFKNPQHPDWLNETINTLTLQIQHLDTLWAEYFDKLQDPQLVQDMLVEYNAIYDATVSQIWTTFEQHCEP